MRHFFRRTKRILALTLATLLTTALAACGVKFITSGINAVFAVVVASALAPVLRKALEQAGVYRRFHGE